MRYVANGTERKSSKGTFFGQRQSAEFSDSLYSRFRSEVHKTEELSNREDVYVTLNKAHQGNPQYHVI